MTTKNTEPLFTLGRMMITPGALEKLEAADQDLSGLLKRHTAGDWAEMDKSDQMENANSVERGGRIFSAYTLKTGDRVWVITECDRSVTTILLPSEY